MTPGQELMVAFAGRNAGAVAAALAAGADVHANVDNVFAQLTPFEYALALTQLTPVLDVEWLRLLLTLARHTPVPDKAVLGVEPRAHVARMRLTARSDAAHALLDALAEELP